MNDNHIEAGFAKSSIFGTWKTGKKLADELDVRVIAVRGGGCTAILAVFDFGLLWPKTCARLSREIGKALKIPSKNIGIFTTQNHCDFKKDDDDIDFPKFRNIFIKAAKRACGNLKPVKIAFVSTHPKPSLNFCRRIKFGKLGAFTFYYGFKRKGDKADATHLVKLALKSLAEGKPYQYRGLVVKSRKDYNVKDCPVKVKGPIYLKKAADDLLQGLFFKDLNNKPIGAIIRFAVHPATTNLAGADHVSGDYPLYICRRVEKVFGGTAVFLPGPTGDQVSCAEKKSIKYGKSLGTRIADAGLKELKNAKWEEKGEVAVDVEKVKIKLRNDCPAEKIARKEIAGVEEKIKLAAANGESLIKIKKLSDRYEVLGYLTWGCDKDWSDLNMYKMSGKTITHPLFILKIGKSVIAGLPGEPFGEYSARLRKETIRNNLIVAEEGNGYLQYFPTKAEYKYNGYEPNCAVSGQTGEKALIDGAKKAIRKITKTSAGRISFGLTKKD